MTVRTGLVVGFCILTTSGCGEKSEPKPAPGGPPAVIPPQAQPPALPPGVTPAPVAPAGSPGRAAVAAAIKASPNAFINDLTVPGQPADLVHVTFREPTDESVAAVAQPLAAAGVPIFVTLSAGGRVTGKAITALVPLKNLYGLSLAGSGIKAGDAGDLAKLPQLQELYLTFPELKDDDLAPLAGLTNLKRLSVDRASAPGVPYEAWKPTDKALAPLAGLTNLRTLQGSLYPDTDAALGYLKGLTRLESLTVRANKGLTDAGFAAVKNLAGLKRLKIEHTSGTKLTPAALDTVAALPALEEFDVDQLPGEPKEYARLAPLKTLRKVRLMSNGPRIVPHLTGLADLDDITLGNASLTDATAADLAKFKNLRRFWAMDAKGVTDAGVAKLAALPHLQTLNLNQSKVTDAGLKQAAGLKELEELSLDGTAVSDASLDVILGFPKLKSLVTIRSKMSKDAVAKVREQKKGIMVIN